jgi:Secretion system C-terminal sorting domain
MRNFSSLRGAVLHLLLLFSGAVVAQQTIVIQPEMVYCLTAVRGKIPWYDPNERAFDLFDGDFVSGYQSVLRGGDGSLPIVPVIVIVELKQGCTLGQMQFAYTGEGTTPLNVKVEIGKPGSWTAPAGWNGLYNAAIGAMPVSYTLNTPLSATNRFLKFTFSQVFKGGIKLTGSGTCDWTLPAYNPAAMPKIPMEQFIGTNSTLGLNNQRTAFLVAPYGSIREYINWGWTEGGPNATTLPTYPTNNQHAFAPTLPVGSDNSYDHYFRQLKEMGVNVLADMMSTTPGMIAVGKTGNTELMLNNSSACNKMQFWERKPANVPFGFTSNFGNEFYIADPNSTHYFNPTAYVRQADRAYQLTARYGRGINIQNGDLKFINTNTAAKSLGLIDHIENWNENDKWWLAPDPNGNCGVASEAERRRIYFTPIEYAAMTLADHNDPNIYSLNVPGSEKLGIKRADPNMTTAMSGISEFDLEYVKGIYMALYDLTGNANAWPFKSVGLHHYAYEGEHGMHPEQDFNEQFEISGARLKEIMRFVQHKLPTNTEVWITEFGWSSFAGDGSGAVPAYSNYNIYDVQSQWTLRQFLLYQSAGIQRAYQFSLQNTLSGGGDMFAYCAALGTTFTSTGATIEYKPVWYGTYTLKNALYGMTFDQETNQNLSGGSIKVQKYSNASKNQKAFVLWSPTENNLSYSNVTLATGLPNTTVTVVRIVDDKIEGLRHTQVTNAAGQVTLSVPVTEMPLVVLMEDQPFMPACDCHIPIGIESASAGAQNLANEQNVITNSDLLCGFGPSVSQTWSSGAGNTATIKLKDAQGQGAAYELYGLYLQYGQGNNGEIKAQFFNADNQPVAFMGSTAGYVFKTDDYSAPFWGSHTTWRRFENLRMNNIARIELTVVSGQVNLGEVSVCGRIMGAGGNNGGGDTGPTCPTPAVVASINAKMLPNLTMRNIWVIPEGAPTDPAKYTLEYRRNDEPNFQVFTGQIATMSGGRMVAYLPNVQPCIEYKMRVNHVDSCGQVSAWRNRTFYVNEGCTMSLPSVGSQTAADCDKTFIKWKYGFSKTGVTYTYQGFVTSTLTVTIPSATNATALTGLPVVPVSTTAFNNYIINNLVAGKTYKVFVRAKGNDGSYTPWHSFTVSTKPLALCNDCVCTWTALDESMISVTGDGSIIQSTLDVNKMVDEQDFIINPTSPCELIPVTPQTGPSTEIGEFWGEVTNNTITKFKINLPTVGAVKHIRLYDGDGCIAGFPDADGDGCQDNALGFSVEYRRPNETTWNPLTQINTKVWRQWREFAVNDQVAAFRLTKHHNHARINEIAVCMTNTANMPQNMQIAGNQTQTEPTIPVSFITADEPSFYPNPVNSTATIDYLGSPNAVYKVVSLSGQTLAQGSISQQKTNIPMQQLPVGIYLIQVTDNANIWSERIVKH